MKIWLRIALVILIIAFGSVEIFQIFSIPLIEKEIIKLEGDKLKAVAATAALNINGDLYKSLNFKKPAVSNRDAFKQIRQQLLNIKNTLMFEEDIYTLNFNNDSNVVFGVMTNKKIFSGEKLHVQNITAIKAYRHVRNIKKCMYTGIYADQYGQWISGVAPILDSEKNVVGIVQADHKSKIISKALNKIKQNIFIFKLIILAVIILLSIFMAKMITNPIKKITKIIQQIANGNYNYNSKIIASGELKELVVSTDLMRRTIVAQQEKIFATINDLKNLNERLKIAKEKAESSDKLKSEFLAMISHEIRTPINILLNYSSLIREELNEEQLQTNKFIFNAIQKAGWRLIRTVDLIVTTAEIQTGSYEITKTKLNIGKLLNSIVVDCKPFVSEKEINFTFENKTESSVLIADEYSIKQIFSNLIDNAVKFTEKGFVEIKLFKNDSNKLVFQIKDTGIGISDEYKEKIFNEFSQEQQGYTRKFDGNGLGLSLVKKCCEINNADLSYESEKEKGTTFTVIFNG